VTKRGSSSAFAWVIGAWLTTGGCTKGQNPIAESRQAQSAPPPHLAADVRPGGGGDAWVAATNLYQIFPATFTPEGTLAAMVGKVEYLRGLGVETVWLMPVFRAMSTHGYDAIDYRQIEPRYGTHEDRLEVAPALRCARLPPRRLQRSRQ
jgi:hypothetical protein